MWGPASAGPEGAPKGGPHVRNTSELPRRSTLYSSDNMRRVGSPVVVGITAALGCVVVSAQGSTFVARDHPAIEYSTRPTHDAVARLNERLQKGQLRLSFDRPSGYLRSVLARLDISPSSQTLVFSENSLQRAHISKAAPRAIYFNDTTAVGWTNGADSLEVASQDATQGVIFYALSQQPQAKPQFVRAGECLQCHLAAETSGVPGLFMMSVLPLSDDQNEYARGWAMDHRTPVEDRWGGWYVTGTQVPQRHLGNVPVLHVPRSYVRADTAPRLATGTGAFDTSAYLTPHSDVVALMVLNHQVHMVNLLTRLGWEARILAHDPSAAATRGLPSHVRDLVRDFVDYLLFIDEAPLPSPVRGSSTFAQEFAAKGPHDSRGRSLRDLDLTNRLLRYPCSFMVYSDAFEALPAAAKNLVYERMWEVLSGKETNKRYGRLSLADRRAIVEILLETKKGVPQYFRAAITG